MKKSGIQENRCSNVAEHLFSDLSSNVYKTWEKNWKCFKASEFFSGNNKMIAACHINIY